MLVAETNQRPSVALPVAMIVAVPERTVVTAMPTDQAGQGVFTNIDAAVVA